MLVKRRRAPAHADPAGGRRYPILGDGLARALRRSGYAVDWVESGPAADAALAAHRYDLLILDLGLLPQAKEGLLELAPANDAFCAKLAQPVEMFGDALGLIGRLRMEKEGIHRGMLDLKKAGIFPVVHGVRSLALQSGLTETNTLQRIRQREHRRVFDQRFGEALRQAYETLLALRLRAGLERQNRGGTADNCAAP